MIAKQSNWNILIPVESTMPTMTNNEPHKTMSIKYKPSHADSYVKKQSRYKIAQSIKKSNDPKVIHYLGGVSTDTDFEYYFNKEDNTFIRYEELPCIKPIEYCNAWNFVISPVGSRYTFHTELTKKTPEQYGYFVNENFFTESQKFMQLPEIISKKNYFWLDFCHAPTEPLLNSINDFLKSYNDFIEEMYLTFYINPRGIVFLENVIDRYGDTLRERAQSVCDTLKEKFCVDNYSFSVLDIYVNNRSPMAVIKMKNKNQMKKTNNENRKNPICNSDNYAMMRNKGFTNLEIQTMWGVPQMAVAAYQAWNTMAGRTWNDQERENTIRLGRQVCQNTIIQSDEHDSENGMI